MPILLYGSEVWGPYANMNFENWDKTKMEQTQTQFLKRVLGCSITTSNIMVRAETGIRPLLNQVIKKYILYLKSLKENVSTLSHEALMYEAKNHDPVCKIENFTRFLDKFNLDSNLWQKSKSEITKICNDR